MVASSISGVLLVARDANPDSRVIGPVKLIIPVSRVADIGSNSHDSRTSLPILVNKYFTKPN
jgi:hypothetical protein